MDLANFDTTKPEQTGTLELKHPGTGVVLKDEKTDKPITITLLGLDHPSVQKERKRVMDKRLGSAVGKGGKVRISADELDEDGMNLLVKCTTSWEGIVFNGQALECTPDNVRMLYTKVPAIREQVDEFVNERSNFLKN